MMQLFQMHEFELKIPKQMAEAKKADQNVLISIRNDFSYLAF
jgi:hypothetical protein